MSLELVFFFPVGTSQCSSIYCLDPFSLLLNNLLCNNDPICVF